jgi:serine/threonine protein kinase
MPLSKGDRLGAYEVIDLLGHGAMGEVYRARDTRLGRDVAIKVLPAAFANDPDRLARLEREARLISQVNHPNICTLFHVVEECLILELVEGETLQQRLLRGPLPLREALRYSAGIAAALEAAHSKGIIHRDLKPANIKITSAGTIKVLDFGVAKLADDSESGAVAPDITAALGGTNEGVLIGTVAYTSPEQAMGDRIDRRSDIWAFGCVLYEMLTARRAFHGTAIADTLGAVMRGEPDWSALPAATPPEIRKLLRRCLEKDRARRLADIADARLEIDDLLAGRPETATQDPAAAINHAVTLPAPRRGHLIAGLAFVAGVTLASAVAFWVFRQPAVAIPPARENPAPVATTPPSSSARSSRSAEASGEVRRNAVPPARDDAPVIPRGPVVSSISLPGGLRWAPAVVSGVPNTILAFSPDGRLIVFSSRSGDVTALWLRSLVSDEVWRLPGTDGGISPFWSPDSASIGFFANQRLKRLDLNGLGARSRDSRELAEPTILCDVRSQRGGTWGPDDTIVFSPFSGGLRRISARGGTVVNLTFPEPRESQHVRPQFIAGTRHVLYRVNSWNGRKNPYYVTSLDSTERKLIGTFDSGNVIYADGHLLFVQNHTLMSQPFDAKNLTVSGAPQPIAGDVLLSTGSPPVFGVFSASQVSKLAYLSQGDDHNDPMTVLANWSSAAKQLAR